MLPVQIGRKDDLPFALAVDFFLLVLRRAMISHAQRFEAIGQHYRSSCLSNVRRSRQPLQKDLAQSMCQVDDVVMGALKRAIGVMVTSKRSLEQMLVSPKTASAKSLQSRTEKRSLEANA